MKGRAVRHTAILVVLAAASTMLLRAQEEDVSARKEKVKAALRIAEFDDARDAAERLKADAPADPDALTLYGDALWASGLFDEAEEQYQQALSRAPEAPRARFGIARSLATRSRLEPALEQTLAALGSNRDDAEVNALAGHIYERLARFDDAADAYERYATLLPPEDITPAETARARVQFLRSFKGRMPLSMRPRDAAELYNVPFKLVKNKVVVQGRVNGTRVDWVLDTGAERTGISPETAFRAGVRPVTTTLTAGVGLPRLRRVQLARIDSLEVGPLKIRNVPVAVRSPAIGGAPRWQGESLSPLALGLSAIVDYRRRQVTLGHALPEEAAPAARDTPSRDTRQTPADAAARALMAGDPDEVRLPMRMHRLPMVRGVLNARHPAYFVVDTGGELISISAEIADALDMHPVRKIPLRVFGLSGLDEGAFLLPGVDLDFQAIGYRKVGLAVLNLRAPSVLLGFQVGGIVGHKFLGGYRVSMDVARSELRLEK